MIGPSPVLRYGPECGSARRQPFSRPGGARARAAAQPLPPFHDVVLFLDELEKRSPADPLQEYQWIFGVPAGRVRGGAAWALGQAAPFNWMVILEWAFAYAGLDSAAAIAVESLRTFVTRTAEPHPLYPCMIELYRARAGDTAGVAGSMRKLKPLFVDRPVPMLGVCPAMVEAFLEAAGPPASEAAASDRLEDLGRLGPDWDWPSSTAMLVVARLRRSRGELEQALRALTCIRYTAFCNNMRVPYLKEEGELAVLVGDTARAIRAFNHYLNIRVDPDPGIVQTEVDGVRAALHALLRAKG